LCVKLVAKISNLCCPEPPTLQTDRQTDGRTDDMRSQDRPLHYSASRGKKLLLRAYIGTHQRSFQRHHPRPPTAFSSSRLEVRDPHPKLQSLLSQERVKIQTSNLARTITGSIRTKAHERFWRKGSVGVSREWQGLSNFFGYPLLPQERENLRISNLGSAFRGSIRTKAH